MPRTQLAALILCACSAAYAAGCQDIPVTWSIYSSYVDSDTGLGMLSAITGDQPDVSTYSGSSGKVAVSARIHICSGTYDATLQLDRGRSYNVSLINPVSNSYGKFPPSTSFLNQVGGGSGTPGALLNIRNIRYCQNHQIPGICTFYTRFTSAMIGTDGNMYHLRMETGPAADSPADSTANCLYPTSPVKVVFTPAALDPSHKDTYVVTPVLQGSAGVAPAVTSGCPASSVTGTWPADVGVLILDGAGNSYNHGQYNVPFKFVIRNQ